MVKGGAFSSDCQASLARAPVLISTAIIRTYEPADQAIATMGPYGARWIVVGGVRALARAPARIPVSTPVAIADKKKRKKDVPTNGAAGREPEASLANIARCSAVGARAGFLATRRARAARLIGQAPSSGTKDGLGSNNKGGLFFLLGRAGKAGG